MVKNNCQRSGCVDVFKAHLVSEAFFEGELEIPILRGSNNKPHDLIPFSQALASDRRDCWVHFYEDDYKFERIWNAPGKYIPLLAQFDGIITPDFSLYRDMPLVMQYWNIYRSRAFGFALEEAGSEVLVNVRFGDERTFDVSCLGVPNNSIIAFGSHGNIKNPIDRSIFIQGSLHAINKLQPKAVVIYGSAPKEIMEHCKLVGIEVLVFKSRFAETHEKRF